MESSCSSQQMDSYLHFVLVRRPIHVATGQTLFVLVTGLARVIETR